MKDWQIIILLTSAIIVIVLSVRVGFLAGSIDDLDKRVTMQETVRIEYHAPSEMSP